MERIVTKCLEKECERRYPSAAELQADLRKLRREPQAHRRLPEKARLWWRKARRLVAVAAGAATLPGSVGAVLFEFRRRPLSRAWDDSIAVSPFAGEGASAELEYLSDGLSEGLINQRQTPAGQPPPFSLCSPNGMHKWSVFSRRMAGRGKISMRTF